MNKSLYNYLSRELSSLAMGSTLWVTNNRLTVELRNRNSPYVSHQEITFSDGDSEIPNDVVRLIGRSEIFVSLEAREGFEAFPGNAFPRALVSAMAYLDDGRLPYVTALVWLKTELQKPVAYGSMMGSGTVRPFFEADRIAWRGMTQEEIESREFLTGMHWAKGVEPLPQLEAE
jgi:hypothetical protein